MCFVIIEIFETKWHFRNNYHNRDGNLSHPNVLFPVASKQKSEKTECPGTFIPLKN